MSRWFPAEVALMERAERLAATHPHRVALNVSPVERDHLASTVGSRDDVEVVSEAVAGWRRIALELACADRDVAERLRDNY